MLSMKSKSIRMLTLVALLVASVMPVFAQRGEKTFGIRGSYVSRNTSASAGLYMTYRFSGLFRLAPSADYVFRHDGSDAFSVNLDTHYTFNLGIRSKVSVYPMVGLGYWAWNTHDSGNAAGVRSDDDTDDVTTRITRLSLNMGAGIEWKLTSSFRLGFEAKYALMKDRPTAVVGISVGYCF